MKPLLLMLLLGLSSHHGIADEDKKPIELSPRLGSGFGKLIEIEGKIVNDRDTRLRAHLEKKLLEVDRVGERRLANPIVMELSVFSFTEIKIPVRGTRVRFRGYETGGFTGIPREAFEDIGLVATTNYHFQSRFQITKRLKLTKAEQGATLKR